MSVWRRWGVRYQYQLQPAGGFLSPAHLPHPPSTLFSLHCFHSHSPPDSLPISTRRILYICFVTLFVFGAFQLLTIALSICDSVFSLCPSFLLLSISPPFCLSLFMMVSFFLQSLQSCRATVILLQTHRKEE